MTEKIFKCISEGLCELDWDIPTCLSQLENQIDKADQPSEASECHDMWTNLEEIEWHTAEKSRTARTAESGAEIEEIEKYLGEKAIEKSTTDEQVLGKSKNELMYLKWLEVNDIIHGMRMRKCFRKNCSFDKVEDSDPDSDCDCDCDCDCDTIDIFELLKRSKRKLMKKIEDQGDGAGSRESVVEYKLLEKLETVEQSLRELDHLDEGNLGTYEQSASLMIDIIENLKEFIAIRTPKGKKRINLPYMQYLAQDWHEILEKVAEIKEYAMKRSKKRFVRFVLRSRRRRVVSVGSSKWSAFAGNVAKLEKMIKQKSEEDANGENAVEDWDDILIQMNAISELIPETGNIRGARFRKLNTIWLKHHTRAYICSSKVYTKKLEKSRSILFM
jgi:hypothetical protein